MSVDRHIGSENVKPGSIRALGIVGDLKSGGPTLLDLRYGTAEDWSLRADFSHGDLLVTVAVDRPTAFRVTDEGNLIWYWAMLKQQGGPWAFVYELEGSAWLTEYNSSAASPDREIRHYLVAGSDECLEILSWEEPVVTSAPRPAQG